MAGRKKQAAHKVSPLAPKRSPKLPPLRGVLLGTAEAGIKYKNRTDLLLAHRLLNRVRVLESGIHPNRHIRLLGKRTEQWLVATSDRVVAHEGRNKGNAQWTAVAGLPNMLGFIAQWRRQLAQAVGDEAKQLFVVTAMVSKIEIGQRSFA